MEVELPLVLGRPPTELIVWHMHIYGNIQQPSIWFVDFCLFACFLVCFVCRRKKSFIPVDMLVKVCLLSLQDTLSGLKPVDESSSDPGLLIKLIFLDKTCATTGFINQSLDFPFHWIHFVCWSCLVCLFAMWCRSYSGKKTGLLCLFSIVIVSWNTIYGARVTNIYHFMVQHLQMCGFWKKVHKLHYTYSL